MLRTAATLLVLLLAACAPEARTPPARAADTLPPPAAPVIPGPAADTTHPVARRVLYVPLYSHNDHRDQHRFIALAVPLSVRNTDPSYPITLAAAHYYDTQGRRVRSYVRQPVRLAPRATMEFVVEDRDREGGSGANFLVELTADRAVTEPVVEAVMIGGSGALSVSFLSAGRALTRGR